MNPIALVRVISLISALGLTATTVVAQTHGVRNTFRIANSWSGSPSELNVDTGWATVAPLVTPGTNNNPGPICSSQGSCQPTSDWGHLRVQGSGLANNGPGNGVFLYLDQGPQARFFDTLTVVSSTLPHGTPVQLQFSLALDGFVDVIDTSPNVSWGATFYASTAYLAFTNSTGVATTNLTFYVGSPLTVYGNLSVALYLQGLLGAGNPTTYGSYAVDLAAHMSVVCTTPGTSIVWASGGTYTDPRASITDVGGGCGPGSPVLASALPVLGQPQPFTVTSSLPNEIVLFAWSPGNPVALPLGSCIVTENAASLSLLVAGLTDASGNATIPTLTPNAPSLLGSRYTIQALVTNVNGPLLGFADLSNGLLVNVGL
jgi:hypothetical protein